MDWYDRRRREKKKKKSEKRDEEESRERKRSGKGMNGMDEALSKMMKDMLQGMGYPTDNLDVNIPFSEIFQNMLDQFNISPEDLEEASRNVDPQEMMRFFQESMKKGNMGQPFMKGFKMTMGPDGKFTVNPMDKRPKSQPREQEEEVYVEPSIDPVLDVFEEDELIIIVAEVPGVQKSDVNIRIEGQKLVLDAVSSQTEKEYFSEVDLSHRVDKNSIKARINNGILEIKLKKR